MTLYAASVFVPQPVLRTSYVRVLVNYQYQYLHQYLYHNLSFARPTSGFSQLSACRITVVPETKVVFCRFFVMQVFVQLFCYVAGAEARGSHVLRHQFLFFHSPFFPPIFFFFSGATRGSHVLRHHAYGVCCLKLLGLKLLVHEALSYSSYVITHMGYAALSYQALSYQCIRS